MATSPQATNGATIRSPSPPSSPEGESFPFATGRTHHAREETLIDTSNGISDEVPLTIPPEQKDDCRTLVLCFDGTGDQFDADNSNIVELFSMLKKDDTTRQMVYYQAGIGTYTNPQIATPLMAKISKTLDEAVAWNLDAHVMDGYEFLMQNHTAGDKICIFGFSRGAYTARSLAGMVHKVGLLPPCNHQQVPFAYKMFTRTDEIGWKQSNAFKKAFSIDVDIEFIGVWDTVNSVGLIPKRLPFTASNKSVRTFRHALALDEHRVKFQPNCWNRPTPTEQTLSISDQAPKKHAKKGPYLRQQAKSSEQKQKQYERYYDHQSHEEPQETDVLEVWFAGCHCDVGGGSVSNDVTSSLARIPLRWMIRQCFVTNTGIMFHTDGLRAVGLDPGALYPSVLPRPDALPVGSARIQPIPPPVSDTRTARERGLPNFAEEPQTGAASATSEEALDLKDAMCPAYDQLQLAKFWWALEVLPLRQSYQRGDTTWASKFGWNLGRGRFIQHQKKAGVKVHRTVKMRMEAGHEDGTEYRPKANLDLSHVDWVD